MDQKALQQQATLLGERLIRSRATLAVAESMTGGAFCALLTSVPGISTVLIGGAVVYSATAKIALAGIDPEVLTKHTTVSTATSMALALGMRRRLQADIGIAVTGNAGPTAEGDAPVGAIHWAIAGPLGVRFMSDRRDGDRVAIQQAAIAAGLDLLSDYLAEMESPSP